MKYTNIRALEKHLEGAAPAHFSNVYMLLAKDRFVRKMASDRLLEFLLKGEKNPDLCLKIFEGDQLTPEGIAEELNTQTLFTQRQVILVDLADKPAKAVTKALEDYCSKPSRSVYLIISAASVNHSTNFYKNAEKSGVILEIAEEKGREKERTLIEWITSKVSAAGKKIEPQASNYLLQQIGTDQATLHNELEKLLCYIGDRPNITVQDVSAICASINIETIWQLGEALFKRDAPAALRISKAMLDDGTAFLALVRQIRNQFQTEFQVCSILSNGGNSSDISKQFPYMTGFILDRHQKMAQAYGMPRFKKGMQQIDTIEVMAKNSAIDHHLLAEMLIMKLVM